MPQKALLLLDNAPSHPNENDLRTDDGAICVMYMPPNVTPLIQPMDQNVIRLTKLHYRKNLLTTIVAKKENNIAAVLKELNLKDAVINLEAAWRKIEKETIVKCWRNILSENSEDDSDDDTPLIVLRDKWQNEKAIANQDERMLEAETLEIVRSAFSEVF